MWAKWALSFGVGAVLLVALVIYVDHIGKSLRTSSLIELVGKATRRTLDQRYPSDGSSPSTS